MHWLGYWGGITREKKRVSALIFFSFGNVTVTEDQILAVWLIFIVLITFHI